MKIIDLFKENNTTIAFEVFPPKPELPLSSIYNSFQEFKQLKPDYMSVTYGAGGGTRSRTVDIAEKLKNEYDIPSMAHFTCVEHTKPEVDNMLDNMEKKGLNNILALRGDPPIGEVDYDYSKNYFKHASELIAYIKKQKNFCIAAAAYLEGHTESTRLKDDLLHLKDKVDAGVDFLVTQLFFDNRLFYDFLDKLASVNINCPVTAGIMPIFKADQMKSMAVRSGCSIPGKLVIMMDKYQNNPDDMKKAGIEYASIQMRDLIDNHVAGIHLYTMNRHKSTKEILKNVL